jgi:hypothetical protein
MSKKTISRGLILILFSGVFSLGYYCGSLRQGEAVAQVGGLGGVVEQAGKMGGPVGTATQLGTSIVEMQEHVNGLQKNIDSLKKIQSALTGK